MFGHDTMDMDTPPLPVTPPPEQTLKTEHEEKCVLKGTITPGVWLAGKTFTSLTRLQKFMENWHHLLWGKVDI